MATWTTCSAPNKLQFRHSDSTTVSVWWPPAPTCWWNSTSQIPRGLGSPGRLYTCGIYRYNWNNTVQRRSMNFSTSHSPSWLLLDLVFPRWLSSALSSIFPSFPTYEENSRCEFPNSQTFGVSKCMCRSSLDPIKSELLLWVRTRTTVLSFLMTAVLLIWLWTWFLFSSPLCL